MRVALVLFCLLLLGSGRLGAVLFLTFYAQMHWTSLLLLKKTINSNHVVLVCFYALHFLCMIVFIHCTFSFFFFFFKRQIHCTGMLLMGAGDSGGSCACALTRLLPTFFLFFWIFFYILTILWFVWSCSVCVCVREYLFYIYFIFWMLCYWVFIWDFKCCIVVCECCVVEYLFKTLNVGLCGVVVFVLTE